VVEVERSRLTEKQPALWLWCNNSRIAWGLAFSPWLVTAFVFALILPIAIRSAAYQEPVQTPDQPSASNPKLTAAEEKDSYEIWSMLLRTEMPGSNTAVWAIKQETQTFPHDGPITLNVCLQPSGDQESTYRPLIDDYVARNKRTFVLERKFDLPQYALIGPTDLKAIE
jgi:hypothetical protein